MAALQQQLQSDRYYLTCFKQDEEFLQFVQNQGQHLDCLIFQASPTLNSLFNSLREQTLLLPAIVLESTDAVEDVEQFRQSTDPSVVAQPLAKTEFRYHSATLWLRQSQIKSIESWLDKALRAFLALPSEETPPSSMNLIGSVQPLQAPLLLQQHRLSEKLKERLGYLGVYYKRNPVNFLRHMTQVQREDFLQQLRRDYREIILIYFSDDPAVNDKIDNFVNMAFFSDVPVSQIVEIHMELMDEFSKQLKLEGRSEEILMDYRLTLIDAIAHLCEMYRRSIPRES